MKTLLMAIGILLFQAHALASGVEDVRILKAAKVCDSEMLKDALSKGGDPNSRSKLYALELAIDSGKASCVEILLKAGAKINPYSEYLHPKAIVPFTRAIYQSNIEVVKVLIQYGAEVDNPSYTLNGDFRTYPLGHALLSTAADHLAIADLIYSTPKASWSGFRFWQIVFKMDNSDHFPWLKKLMSSTVDPDAWKSPEALSAAINVEGPSGNLTRTRYLLDHGVNPGYLHCYTTSECSYNWERHEPLHMAMSHIKNPDLIIKIGNQLVDLGIPLNVVSVDDEDNKISRTIDYIFSGKVLRWAMQKGYYSFELRHLRVYDKEALKALAELYPTGQYENDLIEYLFYQTYIEHPNLTETELRECLEVIKKRTPDFLKLMKAFAGRNVPVHKNAIELAKSFGVENSDFNFFVDFNTSTEDALLLKGYGVKDRGVLIGKPLNDVRQLVQGGYDPNVVSPGGDAWILSARNGKWDIADYLGKNGYKGNFIWQTSPLILAAWQPEQYHHGEYFNNKSMAWFDRALKSFSHFKPSEKANWLVLSLINEGVNFKEMLKIISDQRLNLNEQVLVHNDYGSSMAVSDWIKYKYRLQKLSLFQAYLLYASEPDSKNFMKNQMQLIKLGGDLNLPIFFGTLEAKDQFNLSARPLSFLEINAKKKWDDYDQWSQWLELFISRKGDLNVGFSLEIKSDEAFFNLTNEENGYTLLFLNNFDILQRYLLAVKKSGQIIDLNYEIGTWKGNTSVDNRPNYYCSLTPLMMNALLPGDKVQVTKLLVENGANPNFIRTCNSNEIALSYAMKVGNTKIVEYLEGFLQK